MKEWRGIPREEVPWFPAIDAERCTGCQTCTAFCQNDVLEFDEKTVKVRVARPFNCVVECSTCARLCPSGAISFPGAAEFMAFVRERLGK